MSRGIIIFGSAGAGKTTLGKLVAEGLGYKYFDLDDYIWRRDTEKPYTVMYSKQDKISRLMQDITKTDHFVMGGSMSSFNEPFVPLFDLAIHLTASIDIRIDRIKRRAYESYGDRVLEGGDLFQGNEEFVRNARGYDFDGSPSYMNHRMWADTLPCKLLSLDGGNDLEYNMNIIIEEYKVIKN